MPGLCDVFEMIDGREDDESFDHKLQPGADGSYGRDR